MTLSNLVGKSPFHVIPASDGGWLVMGEATLMPLARFCSKALAEVDASVRAASNGTNVVIHKRLDDWL